MSKRLAQIRFQNRCRSMMMVYGNREKQCQDMRRQVEQWDWDKDQTLRDDLKATMKEDVIKAYDWGLKFEAAKKGEVQDGDV